jgi:hypothetical protein
MTQRLVYSLLKELGGTATKKQILELAIQKGMKNTDVNSKILGAKLSNLCRWEYIKNIGKSTDKGKARIYKIIDEFPSA